MQSHHFNGKVVKHVSISFKDLIPLSGNIHSIYERQSSPKENFKIFPNRQSGPKILHLSILSLMKENESIYEDQNLCVRRNKLKELSQGFKLKRDTFRERKFADN
jgi:hypothetical protein